MARRWVAVVGPPGSEARFFGSLLSARLRVPLLSVHNAATVERAHNTFLGQQLEQLTATQVGELWPAQLVAQMVQGPLQRAQQTNSGLVSANFPRDLTQWRMLRTFAPAPHMISLTASRDELDRRLRHRRVCSECDAPMYPPSASMLEAAAASLAEQGRSMPSSSELYTPMVGHLAGCSEASDLRRLGTDEGAALDARWREYEGRTLPMLTELRDAGQAQVINVELAEEAEETWTGLLRACGAPED